MSAKQIVQGSDVASAAGSTAAVDNEACTGANSAPKEKVHS
jgi:hypothetical protein